jgi:hypothetical protein
MSENKVRSIIDEISDSISLYSQARKAADTTDYTKVEELMLSEKYSYMPQEKKEVTILRVALEPIQFQKIKGDLTESEYNFIHYLVFNYQIDEDIYSNMASEYKSPIIEDMFAKRKLNSELATELVSSENTIKKPKV